MFCPKCSRPITDDVQFCQQCGFGLEGVRKLLSGDDTPDAALATATALAKASGVLSPRQRGIRQGLKLTLLAVLILPLYPVVEALLEELIPSVENTRLDELPLELFGTLLFMLFFGGLMRMLYARLFESAGLHGDLSKTGAHLPRAKRQEALPPSHSIPAEDFIGGRVVTADLARPRSVTEHTTRSLRLD
jgi:hypothetical protein